MAETRTTTQGYTLIAGLGKSGLACARYLAARGESIVVADSRAEPPGLAELRAELPHIECHCGPFQAALFEAAARIVISPGIDPNVGLFKQAREAGVEQLNEIELFAREAKAPVIAITGSNGKSTVTELLGEMARAAGKKVGVGGNIGTPALELLSDDYELFVLELSSFQLELCTSLNAAAAVVLNVSDDHLDRHHDLENYAAIKRTIYRGDGVVVVNREDARVMAMGEAGRECVSFGLDAPATANDYGIVEGWLAQGDEMIIEAAELKIAGRHNQANALAALALGDAVGLAREGMLSGLRAFPGLPHRCQWLAEKGGVNWYNDSKGTNVGATLAAIEGVPGERVVLIAGGQGKGQDFAPLKPALAARGRAAVLIGEDAELIAAALGDALPLLNAASMDEAVAHAANWAQAGDAVLLSPACASFDMFSGYAQRGERFAECVREVAA